VCFYKLDAMPNATVDFNTCGETCEWQHMSCLRQHYAAYCELITASTMLNFFAHAAWAATVCQACHMDAEALKPAASCKQLYTMHTC
jgi:hypothetical protein